MANEAEHKRRDAIVARAIEEGRIASSRRAHWRAAFDRNPRGVAVLLTAPPKLGGMTRGKFR